MALDAKQSNDGKFLERAVNTILIPKLINLGFKIDLNYPWVLDNDAEKNEQRNNEDKSNLETAEIVYQLKQAGFDVDPEYITERTGIPVTKTIVAPTVIAPKLSDDVKNRLKETYK